ncbi:MAG: peptide deformylase [Oscillospiraceae bacterium]|nr:peptide deformylase [Oscillospiraceae bacterium]
MAIRNILTGDEPTLQKKSRAVTEFNNRLHILLDDMHQTLEAANGLGLAAPQVGVLRRVALIVEVIDGDGEEDFEENVIELINPKIISQEGIQEGLEGCLSVPGAYGTVCRPKSVTVRAQDRFGDTFEIQCSGMTARAACHEIDHLNGVLFTILTDHILTEEELDQLGKSDPEN